MEEYFLKIDGIPGESQDSKHKDEIELASFSWGLDQAGLRAGAGGAGGKAGRAQFDDFHFTMRVNKASPQLFLACASGKHIKEASLSVRRAGKAQLEYLKIKLSEVFVTSYHQAGGQEPPEEMVAFGFGRVDLEYTTQQRSGGTGAAAKVGWDLSKNSKI